MRKSNEKAERAIPSVAENPKHETNDDLFRILAETATDAIVTIDQDSAILFVNPATERIFGYASSELLGRGITMLMPEYLRELHRTAVRRYVATGEKHISWTGVELTGLHKSGREIPVEVSFGEQLREGRRIFTGIIRDASERRRAEEELRQAKEKYARMIQSSPDAITLRTLPERRYLEVNEGFTRMTGYTAEEVLGRTSSELNLWVDPGRHQRTLEEVLLKGEVRAVEFPFRKKSGEIRYGQLAAAQVIVGNQPCILSITRDITERKLAEQELRSSEANFRLLVEDAPFGIFRVTLEGRILQANAAMVTMLGYSSEAELVNRNMAAGICRDPNQWPRLIDEHAQEQGFRNVEVEWMRKDGRSISVVLTGHIVVGSRDAPAGFEVFAEDVTERRTLERQFLQSQKMEAIGRLAGGIAHDFNNFLGVILGHAEALDQRTAGDPALHESVQAIRGATERAAALTTQLLAFSRKQVMTPKILDLNGSVREMEKLLCRVLGEDIELILRLQPELGTVQLDPGQLDQVLMNLAVNARDAMPNGGKLILETADVTLDESYLGRHPGAASGPFVMLTVSDTGTGMDRETLSHIFEPFFTTKEIGKGTGLGLATVYGIVKQSGGYIMAYSEPGHGTSFKLYFPRVSGTPEVSRPSDNGPAVLTGTETVLLVEDNTALRAPTRMLLEGAGYRVLEASNGEEAVRIAKRSGCAIDLLLTDVVMPDMDGNELARRLGSFCQTLKVLYVSGYAHDVIVHRGIRVEGTRLLQKPFSRNALLRSVREALST